MKFGFLILLILLLTACSQNMDTVNSGERLEDSPKPAADPNVAPLARAGAAEEQPKIPP